MTKRVSIYDIAVATGLSHTTVNQALRGSDCVKLETKAFILETAKRMGYHRNYLASTLRTGESKHIALITPHSSRTFQHNDFANILQKQLNKKGYEMVLYPSLTPTNGDAIFERILKNFYDGVVTFIFSYAQFAPFADAFQQRHCPVAIMGIPEGAPPSPGVIPFHIHNLECVREVMEHLYSLGHRHILHAIPRGGQDGPQNRVYLQFMQEKGLSVRQEDCIYDSIGSDLETGFVYAEKLLRDCPQVTALQCPSDAFAWGLIRCFKDHGVRVPEDVSVIGSGFSNICNYTLPRLASIEVGETNAVPELVDALLACRKAKNWEEPPQEFYLKAQFHPGESITTAP